VKLPEWITRKVGPLPVWGWAAAGAGGLFAIRWYLSHKAAAGQPTSGTAVPIGGSPFDYGSLGDSGGLVPTSSIPTTAQTATNTGDPNASSGGGGTSATSTNTAPAGSPTGSGPGGQSRINLTSPPPNFYTPAPAPAATAPQETRISLTNPPPNFYTAMPVTAPARTAGTVPLGGYGRV
jgi:hypothetical protein